MIVYWKQAFLASLYHVMNVEVVVTQFRHYAVIALQVG